MKMNKQLLKIQWISFSAMLTTQLQRIARLWVQTLLPPIITMSLYFLIFGGVIGSQISKIHGFTYMQYISPGLIMMSAITNSYGHITAVVFGAKFQRHIDELLVSPTSNITILLGYICGGMVRGFISALVVFFVALFFTHIHIMHPFFAILVVFLSSALLSLGAFINSIYAKKIDDVSIIPTFILTPLTYLGGVFYSISALPKLWQEISLCNPILYLINAFRYSFFGISDVPIWDALMMIGFFVLLLFLICYKLLDKGIGMRS